MRKFKIEKVTFQYTFPTELTMTLELSNPVGGRTAEIRYVPEDENTDFDKWQIKDSETIF